VRPADNNLLLNAEESSCGGQPAAPASLLKAAAAGWAVRKGRAPLVEQRQLTRASRPTSHLLALGNGKQIC
jgi:hypothetical protein